MMKKVYEDDIQVAYEDEKGARITSLKLKEFEDRLFESVMKDYDQVDIDVKFTEEGFKKAEEKFEKFKEESDPLHYLSIQGLMKKFSENFQMSMLLTANI